jgi:HSP20 family protein
MSLIHWHPLKKLNNLRQQIDSLVEEMTHQYRSLDNRQFGRLVDFDLEPEGIEIDWSPAIALTETETKLILKVELPGIKTKDIDIQVSDCLVSIAGERKKEKHHQKKGAFFTELYYGRFKRVISLPIAIDNSQIEADLTNGLLTLSMSKKQAMKENTVKINLVEAQARQGITEQRQHRERQQETMQERAIEELQESSNNDEHLKEETREMMVEQRQQEKHQQETMHARTADEVKAKS